MAQQLSLVASSELQLCNDMVVRWCTVTATALATKLLLASHHFCIAWLTCSTAQGVLSKVGLAVLPC
jgi:hypothetical protein